MAILTDSQVRAIKEKMIADDEKALKSKFKSKNSIFDYMSIDINQIDEYKEKGWETTVILKHKARIQKKKEHWRLFEDDIWCMFYNLGFQTLNYDEDLVVPWGAGDGDHQQLDVVAVGEDAIFVVECKAAEKPTQGHFKKDIDTLTLHKDGIIKALKQIYGKEKKVKLIFATRNYRFSDSSEDLLRLKDKNIYHFNENSYNYIINLIKAYKSSVIYQFYGLMFKDELINNDRIKIPALKGKMGGHYYYMLSIEPENLLKISFVLHRTKVNDSMAPTYQRLLVPSRLKGITKFIDDGGYFPNSIIVNFDSPCQKNRIIFEPSDKTDDSKSRLGILSIPNAYGIAYIIDGQHRVYGYAGSKYKQSNTIPVVAFDNMESQEQLRIFMDINENQKAVSPSLRLDLAEDINWDSSRIDSRMIALRSSIIKVLSKDSNSVLFTKISVGEDNAKLSFKPFDTALSKSSLLPKASNSRFTEHTEECLYDCKNHDYDKAMNDSKKRISSLIKECYTYIHNKLTDDIYKTYIECNRGTYAFVVLIGNLNSFLIQKGILVQTANVSDQINAFAKYFDVLCSYLINIPVEHKDRLLSFKGQGADVEWLHTFEDAISVEYEDFLPNGIEEWREAKDKNLQQRGKEFGEQIEEYLHVHIIEKLQELFGDNWDKNNMRELKYKCMQKMAESVGDDSDIIEEDWVDYIQLSDIKDIIDKYWTSTKDGDTDNYVTFADEFSIKTSDDCPFKSKKDNLKWLSDLIIFRTSWESTKGKPLTRAQVDELNYIHQKLIPKDMDLETPII